MMRPCACLTVAQVDATTLDLTVVVAGWTQTKNLGDKAAARKIHAGAIHILIDPGGHTATNRLPAFAHRSTSMHLSLLRCLAGTGVDAIDHCIGDPVSVAAQIDKQNRFMRHRPHN